MRALFLLLPLALVAKPAGMKTLSGKASCKEQSGTLVIESGKRAVVKWDEFSIGKDEKVRFAMPDQKSAILNRVSGARSELLGQLESNGKVYLLNPKGVLIGKDAVINTAGFVASSLDVLDQDFLRGEELLFSGDSQADVINLGKISCMQGEVALIAHNVANRGNIKGDFVALASGPKILLKPEGNQRIFVQAKGGTSIQQSGEIQSLVTELRTGSVYDKAISCEGKIEATSSKKSKGRIYLVAEHGKTNFDGEIEAKGGEVHILGDKIFLGDHAHVDISAENGGGTLLVGGDYRGLDMEIPNALDVVVTNGAFIDADAKKEGNGGKVVFWADREMKFFGEITSRGGSEGGDGGFVEVSGNQSLLYRGKCDCRAPFGKLGDLLLDPDTDVVISAGADSGMNLTLPTFSPTSNPAVLNVDTLTTNLATASVTVTTSGSATPTGTGGTLTVSVPIDWSFASTLTLDAAVDIDIDAAITNTVGSLIATAANDVNVNTGASISTDAITLTAATGSVTANMATLTCGSGGMTITGVQTAANTADAVSITTCALTTNSGNIAISGDAHLETGASNIRGVTLFDSIITSGSGSAGTITVTGEGGSGVDNCYGVELNGTAITSTNGNILLSGNQNFIPSTTGNSGHGIQLDSSASVTTLGPATIQFTGTGAASTTGSADGVRISDSSVVSDTAATGSITIDGLSGLGVAGSNFGTSIVNASAITSTTGAITINGNQAVTTPLSPGGSNRGINIDGNGSVLLIRSLGTGSTAASITITGTGVSDGGGGTNNRGVQIEGGGVADGAQITSIDGSILITGTRGPSTNVAVQVQGGALIETTGTIDTGTTTNNVTITTGLGTSGEIVISSSDIKVASAQSDITIAPDTGGSIGISSTSLIEKTGTAGTLTIRTPSDTSSGSSAVAISDSIISSTAVTTISGTKTGGTGAGVEVTGATAAITFGTTGTITGTSIDDHGVRFGNSTTFTGGSGLATLSGTVASSTVTPVSGVSIGTATFTGGAGNIETIGTNNATGISDLIGISLSGTSVINSGSGTFTFTGTGGDGTSDNYGIHLLNAALLSASSTGGLIFSGTGGDGSSTDNHGVLINGASTLTGTSIGPISITGNSGAGSNNDHGILINTAGTTVTCTDGGITLTGRSFSNSSSSSSGVNVNTGPLIETTGFGDVVLNGTGSVAAANEAIGTNIGSMATITTSAAGNLSLTGAGGAGSTNNYGIFLFESDVSSTSSGQVILNGTAGDGASALQGVRIQDATLTSLDGNISVTGVGGLGASGGSHGITIRNLATVSSTGSATINFDGRAGSGATSDAGVDIRDTPTLVTSATGKINLIGRASGTSTMGIHITDDGLVSSTVSAPIALQTFSDIVIDEGGSVVGSSGLVTVDSARDLIINGNTTAVTPSGIFLGTGNFRGAVGRDVTLTGGTFATTFAQIGANSASSTAAIRFPNIGRNLLIDGENTDGYALIGHGDPSSTFTYNAPINFTFIGGSATITGATVAGGAAGFAQIGHAGVAGSSLGGDITVRPFGDMNILGGSASATSFARIGHGGHGGAPTLTASTHLLAAGRNFTLQESAGFGAAQAENGNGPLTIVTDNRNPIPPGFGIAGVNLDGTLNATRQLRIYTVDRPENSIISLINGEAFMPGTGRGNNPQEQFGVYFPQGDFSTAAFRIYYKIGRSRGSRIDLFNGLLVANTELQDDLPLFRFMRLPNYPFYHTNICEIRRRKLLCDPGFDPYGSLNFEDDVYWLGEAPL
ncbi:MAG: filamentous hemagglutinin N-terminal domain-containing protein [Candidatus Algichlamydia australiensis]|nr:filamentous hemagglutinin N-terminal domain-containing protein [Chlamydiales bacterium]